MRNIKPEMFQRKTRVFFKQGKAFLKAKFKMIQTFDLNKMGLEPMSYSDMQNIDGGLEWPGWLKSVGWAAVAKEVVDHWDDIKHGLADGWNGLK